MKAFEVTFAKTIYTTVKFMNVKDEAEALRKAERSHYKEEHGEVVEAKEVPNVMPKYSPT